MYIEVLLILQIHDKGRTNRQHDVTLIPSSKN